MRRFFREILSLCLVLAMLTVGCMAGLCEEAPASEEELDYVSFEPLFGNILEYSPSEWFSSKLNRALLTVCISLELMSIIDEDVIDFSEALLTESSYVARDGLALVLYYHGKQNDIIVLYMPLTGEAAYQIGDKAEDFRVSYVLEEIAEDGCYKNDIDDIIEVIALLKGTLSD